MARFDVFENPDGDGYLLDVQADILDALNTTIVIPLLPLDKAPEPARRLNPVLEVEGDPVVMATQFMAAVPCAILSKPLARLDAHETEITNALDMVFFGF